MRPIAVPPRKGSRHGSAKLDEQFVMDIRRSAHDMGYYPVARAARANRVTYRTVKDALIGQTYSHVDKRVRPFHGPTRKPGGCVVRIDSESTHGYQARFRKTSKFFSDRRWGKRGAMAEARSWLTRQQQLAIRRG